MQEIHAILKGKSRDKNTSDKTSKYMARRGDKIEVRHGGLSLHVSLCEDLVYEYDSSWKKGVSPSYRYSLRLDVPASS